MDSDSDLTSALLLLLLKRRKKCSKRKQNQKRRWWVRPINRNREKSGEYQRLVLEMRLHDEEWFFNYIRMTPTLFENLLSLVAPRLMKRSIRRPLNPAQRLAMTLRFLATGDSYFSIASGYSVGRSTVCTAIQEVTQIIWEILWPIYLAPPTEEKFKNIAEDFWKTWNMPQCVGCIDGKHIRIFSPPNSGSLYYNYKGHFSIILLGICDADYNFTFVDIGAYGSVSDGGVFSTSTFGQELTNNTIPLPPQTELPGSNTLMNHFFVGDAAFPLMTHLMRPYAGRSLNILKGVFNYRLSRARRVIENTFDILVARWRIFHRAICASPTTIDNIIKATVCLHNFIRSSKAAKERYSPPNYVDQDNILGKWRDEVEGCIMNNCVRLGSNNASLAANQQRDILAKYFLTPAGFKKGQIEYVKRT